MIGILLLWLSIFNAQSDSLRLSELHVAAEQNWPTVIHRPKVLFLDEPTTGVDAVSRREFWDMLDKLRAQGLTILVSTPYMDEASRCDRIALMLDGGILLTDTPAGIRSGFKGELYAVKSAQIYLLLTTLRKHPDLVDVYPFGESVHVTVGNVGVDIESFLKEHGITAQVERIDPTVEDVFLSLAGRITNQEVGNEA
jgi:ABC-type multidrug transport system ATPase subunit